MNSIFVLHVVCFDEYDEECDCFDMYFSTLEKSESFITNNFEYDRPRRLSENYFEGKRNKYIIEECGIDQDRM